MLHGERKLGAHLYWELNRANLQLTTADGTAVGIVARQVVEVVECEPEKHDGRYRVSTRAYEYSLALDGEDQFRFDWHPDGRSTEGRPHIHTPPGMRRHWIGGRQTFEDFVENCIEVGVTPARDDYRDVLEVSRSTHKLYRSWS
ncbi:hypothetical protein CEY15_02355 [Dietzia natronolimnaea]|uniref:Uncharacterized protein n=1 Tax=Dietzia natronolimnaea TaxID=161920 RepID=A0A2A2WU12_9ACTN|nr:hypothetical protein CEY15_02355 [Dietzia natronolimnaea]